MMGWSPVSFEPAGACYWSGEDLGVIYNPLCGDTHLVLPIAIDLLEAIRLRPDSTVAELASQFAGYFDCDSQVTILESLDVVLQQLAAIGLIRAHRT